MSALSDACRAPFANATEGDAWESKWCSHCAHDHGMHDGTDNPLCDLMGVAIVGEWPSESWVPEPDDGRYFLPSRLVCLRFTPCEPCGGDPGATERAERIVEVTAYWRTRA